MKKFNNPFLNMAAYGLMGALCGLVTGFVFGLIIYGVATLLYEDQILEGMYPVATFLGMGVGTAIGAIMGSIVGIKKK